MNEETMKNAMPFAENVFLMGDGQFNYIGNAALHTPAANEPRQCNCGKASNLQRADCSNCNLELCEHCGVSCKQCNVPLCTACVVLL